MKRHFTKTPLLADKFIRLTQNQDLYPQVSNISIFSPRISVYGFGSFYEDTTPTPYIAIMKESCDSFVLLPETKFKNIAREMFKKYWRNPKFLHNHIREIDKCIKKINNIYSSCDYKKIISTPIEKLVNVAKQTIHVNRRLNTLIWFVLHFNEEFCSELLKENNIKISKDRLKEIWQKGTIPAFVSFDKVRHLYVLDLIKKETKWADIAEKCQFFFANYSSIGSLDLAKRELYKQYGTYSLKEIGSLLKKENEEKIKKLSDYKKWFRSLNKNEQKLIIYLQEIMRIRDIRKNAVSQALTIVHRIAQQIFKKANVKEDLIRYYSCDEILYGLKYLMNNKYNLRKRTKGIVMMFFVDSDAPVEFEYGTYEETREKLEKYYRDKQLSVSAANQKEIKGQAACLGKVTGVVKIVLDPSKVKDFKYGDILVTGMTRPEFVPLMKKAAAVITDEGGITSHAAIVSRELKIPCVIGTKIATKILKDGDVVEVDANKGIVKILKKTS